MPVSVTIRDVPDEIRAELAARAARAGQSLQEYLLGRLTAEARSSTPEEVLDRLERTADVSLGPAEAAELVRAERESH